MHVSPPKHRTYYLATTRKVWEADPPHGFGKDINRVLHLADYDRHKGTRQLARFAPPTGAKYVAEKLDTALAEARATFVQKLLLIDTQAWGDGWFAEKMADPTHPASAFRVFSGPIRIDKAVCFHRILSEPRCRTHYDTLSSVDPKRCLDPVDAEKDSPLPYRVSCEVTAQLRLGLGDGGCDAIRYPSVQDPPDGHCVCLISPDKFESQLELVTDTKPS